MLELLKVPLIALYIGCLLFMQKVADKKQKKT